MLKSIAITLLILVISGTVYAVDQNGQTVNQDVQTSKLLLDPTVNGADFSQLLIGENGAALECNQGAHCTTKRDCGFAAVCDSNNKCLCL